MNKTAAKLEAAVRRAGKECGLTKDVNDGFAVLNNFLTKAEF